MGRIRWYGPTVMLLITVLMLMIVGPNLVRQLTWANTDARIALVKDGLASNPSLAELSDAFRKVATVVEPSVVSIQIYSRQTAERRRSLEEQLRRMLPPHMVPPDLGEDEDAPDTPAPAPRGRGRDRENFERFNAPQLSGNGSGWVYDAAGHIITNNHVVDGADKIVVRFADGSERTARIVGADGRTDVAVIKVDGDNLHPASLADKPVEQGDIVFAFGSPFRFEFSMSQGIVSGKGRRLGILSDGQGYESFIQTDAAINPGNSGGPLTNIHGRVVGMNSAIATRTGAFSGLGFAIPVDMVKKVVDQLIKTGKVTRGYLGVFIEEMDAKMAATFGYTGKGVLVAANPIEGGPAEKAGLQRGDIITKIDGTAVTTPDELRNLVAGMAPGKKISLELFRNGKLQTIEATIAELPPDREVRGPGRATPDAASPSDQNLALLRRLGIESAANLTESLANRYRLDYTPGVLVQSVRPDSAAAAAGLLRGQIITDVMGAPVKTVDDLVKELKKHDLKKGVRVSVTQEGQSRFLLLEMENAE